MEKDQSQLWKCIYLICTILKLKKNPLKLISFNQIWRRWRHLEVGGVDPELVGMQSLQGSQADSQLADVLGSFCDCQNNLPAMGEHVFGARTDVQVREVCFAAWECGEQPVE